MPGRDTGNGNDEKPCQVGRCEVTPGEELMQNHAKCTCGCHTCHGNPRKPRQVGCTRGTPGMKMTEIMPGVPADVTPVTEIAANHARWADVV